MATPILDTIADLIVARLSVATWSSPYQIREIKRPNQRQGNVEPGPFECIVQLIDFDQTEGSEYEEEAGPNPFYRLTATYGAGVRVMEPAETKEPHDTLSTHLLFDMSKAITIPNSSWHEWGGNSLNSRWKPAIRIDGEGGSIMVVGLLIEVDVCLKSTDPYTFRG